MTKRRTPVAFVLLVMLGLLGAARTAQAQMYGGPPAPSGIPVDSAPAGTGASASARPAALRDVWLEQRMDAAMPLSRAFEDSTGASTTIGRLLGGKPLVLVFVYLDCPLLCSQVLDGVVRGLRPLRLTAGRDFTVAALSFDPGDTPAKAAVTKARLVKDYGRPSGAHGFEILTGRQADIAAATSAAGFHYTRDDRTGQFFHPSTVIVLTPEGRISRYLSGVDFAPRDLQLALLEAASGRIGSRLDRLLLYCYHYDPASGRYSVLTFRLLKVGGVITMAALGLLIGGAIWRERRRGPRAPDAS